MNKFKVVYYEQGEKVLRYVYSNGEQDIQTIFKKFGELKITRVTGFVQIIWFLFQFALPRNRTSSNVKQVILNQIVGMFTSGIPIIQAILLIQRDFENIRVQRQFYQVFVSLSKGDDIGVALSCANKIFPKYLALILKEVSTSIQVVEIIQHFLDSTKEVVLIKSKILIQFLLFIPILLGSLAWMSTEAILYGQKWLDGYRYVLGIKPPWVVKFYVDFFTFNFISWAYYFVGIVLIIYAFRRITRISKYKLMFDKIKFFTPVLKEYIRIPVAFNFLSTFKIYLDHGQTLYPALKKSAATLTNEYARFQVDNMLKDIEKGIPIEACFNHLTLFNRMEKGAFYSALQTGSIRDSMEVIESLIERRYRLLIRSSEFIFRLLAIAILGLIFSFYIYVQFRISISF